MNTDQLRFFALTYQERNYSAAARKIPVSHQGLVKSIRALEKELDVPLFVASKETGMPVPTVFAEELYEFVSVFDANLYQLRQSFDHLKERESGRIRLGCSLGIHNAMGSQFFQDFADTHSYVDFQLFESDDKICDKAMAERQYDVAIVVNPLTPGCVGEALYESPMYFWTKGDTPLARRAREGKWGTVEDLAGFSIAIPGRGFKCFDQLNELAASHGVELGPRIEMSEIFQIYEFVSCGKGLGFSNGTLIDMRGFRYDPDVVAVPVEGLTWGFSIEHLRDHVMSELERRFWGRCVQHARGLPHNTLASGS